MNTQKNVKTNVNKYNLQFSFTAKSNDQLMMHPANNSINLMYCLAYIYFVLKDVFFSPFFTLEKSPLYSKNGRCSEDKMH